MSRLPTTGALIAAALIASPAAAGDVGKGKICTMNREVPYEWNCQGAGMGDQFATGTKLRVLDIMGVGVGPRCPAGSDRQVLVEPVENQSDYMRGGLHWVSPLFLVCPD